MGERCCWRCKGWLPLEGSSGPGVAGGEQQQNGGRHGQQKQGGQCRCSWGTVNSLLVAVGVAADMSAPFEAPDAANSRDPPFAAARAMELVGGGGSRHFRACQLRGERLPRSAQAAGPGWLRSPSAAVGTATPAVRDHRGRHRWGWHAADAAASADLVRIREAEAEPAAGTLW